MSLPRVTYDPTADAAYVRLTDAGLEPGRDVVATSAPDDGAARPVVLLDWKDGRLVGVEILGASMVLAPDLLAVAEVAGATDPQ